MSSGGVTRKGKIDLFMRRTRLCLSIAWINYIFMNIDIQFIKQIWGISLSASSSSLISMNVFGGVKRSHID